MAASASALRRYTGFRQAMLKRGDFSSEKNGEDARDDDERARDSLTELLGKEDSHGKKADDRGCDQAPRHATLRARVQRPGRVDGHDDGAAVRRGPRQFTDAWNTSLGRIFVTYDFDVRKREGQQTHQPRCDREDYSGAPCRYRSYDCGYNPGYDNANPCHD
jgi:hypothetical protein